MARVQVCKLKAHLVQMGVNRSGRTKCWWWQGVNLGSSEEEGDPQGSLSLSLSQLQHNKLTLRSHRVCAHVIQQHPCVFASVCDGLPEGTLCASVTLERQMSRADILGRPELNLS